MARRARILVIGLVAFTLTNLGWTQEPPNQSPKDAATNREAILLEKIRQLEERIARLEQKESVTPSAAAKPTAPAVIAAVPNSPDTETAAASPSTGLDKQIATTGDHSSSLAKLLDGTTFNVNLDGYYGYNFNRPIGRVNLLRPYDVSSNSFSLNQAGLVIERAPNVELGRRFGVRLDLQYGQATETLQGAAQNELRPQVYRNLFQAYGTYVFPIGKGLTVDFGKFASSLGYESNYTKDQINYSRAYWFNFLPYYHMGFRSTYAVNDKLSITNWLVNGAQQTEDFNGFKSTAFLVNVKPRKNISWNINYYFGQEQRDVVAVYNPDLPLPGSQPGLPSQGISPAPNGRFHVLDTYASWNVGEKLLLVGEGDVVINRVEQSASPGRAFGAAAYAKYQFTPAFSLGGRFEYFGDKSGLFSNVNQALKETTLTATYRFADGFQTMLEYRRDFSNRPYFLTTTPGLLKKEQNTATLGMIWWFGGKEGSW